MEGRRSQSKKKLSLGMGGGGGIGNIRSPLVKRDQHSQVVIRGWLFKLEGALAMKQWKKRWFILSDFCLFYYKESDEDKLLGSILLPSYKINPCISEDRISKKFAFKAEHANMKTYYFASDSKESMSQWMNAMSLATIMQKDTTCDVLAERGYGSPVLLDDEESGFSSYRPRRMPHHHSSINPSSMAAINNSFHSDRHPRSHHSAVYPENLNNSREFENGYLGADAKYPSRTIGEGLAPRRHPGQPLYANAPPKPRRLTGPHHDSDAAGNDYPLDYSDSHLADYYSNNSPYRMEHSERESLDYNSDWPAGMPYQDNYVYGSGYYPTSENRDSLPRRHDVDTHSNQPPRPHSADFLERQSVVDASYPTPVLANQPKPRQRPKSSLEQYDRRHYWDDETAPIGEHGQNYSYDAAHGTWSAHGHRQESDYNLQANALHNLNASKSPPSSLYSASPSSSLRRSQPNVHGHVPYDYGLPDIPSPKISLNTTAIDAELVLKDNEPPGLTKWPTMHPTKHPGYPIDAKFFDQDVVTRRPPHDHRARPLSAEYQTGDPAYAHHSHPDYQQQERFMSDRDQKKVQLREESMKRLLEWKQRMLQSPLSRKYSPRSLTQGSPRSSPSHSVGSRPNIPPPCSMESLPGTPTSPPARPPLPEEYRQKVLQDLENHEARLRLQENVALAHQNSQYYNNYGPPALMRAATDIENQPPYNVVNEKMSKMDKSPVHIPSVHSIPTHTVPPLNSTPPSQKVTPVGDINASIESNSDDTKFSKTESRTDKEKEANKYLPRTQSDPRKQAAANRLGPHQSYSSDDEEYETRQRTRRTRRPSQAFSATKPKSFNQEEYERPAQVPSPDYVNLNVINKRHKEDSHTPDGPSDTKLSSQYQNNLNDNAEDENRDYYIRREDYYRASQLFYSKTKNASLEAERSPKGYPNKYEADCEPKVTSPQYSVTLEERSLGDGVESNNDDRTDHKREGYNASYSNFKIGLPESPSSRRRETKIDTGRLRSQSLPRNASAQERFYPKPDVCQMADAPNWSEEPVLIRSSSTDMFDSADQICGGFHRQTSLRTVSDSKKHCSTLKHNYSFEEMRTQLAKQREAPPANIVSQRIKHFESSAEALDDSKKASPPAIGIGELLTKGTGLMESSGEDHKEKSYKSEPNVSVKLTYDASPQASDFNLKSELKNLDQEPSLPENKLTWQSSFQRRQFCSDSDVGRSLCKKDSNSTTEDSSIASAPIILSPLSSVLADLRRTADTKKEKKKMVDEVIITKGALRLSMAESKDVSLENKDLDGSLPDDQKLNEEEYLTMTKGKQTEDEAVYVAMDEDIEAEPVYNEPVLPPSSFLHDIFGKQKSPKNFSSQRNSYSSSDESNNVYEKPNWKNTKEKTHHQTKPEPTEENPVYEEPYSMTPYRQWNLCSGEENVGTEVEESIPDLLNHEENVRKDTDASDADDEASRDFDTPQNIRNGLPSYQKEVLMGEIALTESESQFDQSRALPLIPKYSPHTDESSLQMDIQLKEPTAVVHQSLEDNSRGPSGSNSVNDFSKYQHFKVYDDERRCTEFVYKPIDKGNLSVSSTINLKQIRIYKEGKEPGKLKFHSHSASQLTENVNSTIDPTRTKPKLSLDAQIESQLHLHIKPLQSYSDDASNSLDDTNLIECSSSVNSKHAKSSSYDSASPVKTQSYATPDVVPFQSLDTSQPRRNSATSAPYYVGDVIRKTGGAGMQDHEEFPLSPRSSRALLNNVRDVSPSQSRGDIGRKVNVIQESPVVLNNARANEESVSVSMARELRASLEQLLSPESKKFLDAERNKYEAGHTLEKTHQSSSLSKLKKRSATPDFDHFYRNNEPDYENLSSTKNNASNSLTKRLSRSLDGLIDSGAPTDQVPLTEEWESASKEQPPPPPEKEEPFYENIVFMREEDKKFRESNISERNEAQTYVADWNPNPPSLHFGADQNLTDQDPKMLVLPTIGLETIDLKVDHRELMGRQIALNSLGDERDSDSEYLDENILRRESQRHFLAQGLGEKMVGCTNQTKGMSVSPKQATINLNSSYNQEEATLVELHPTKPQINPNTTPKTPTSKYAGYVSTDSSSDLTMPPEFPLDSIVGTSSVCDELSRQRQRHLSGLSKENLNSSDSELHKQTCSKVKRLIQRSQGLSREGKRLSISAGDLLEKSHEELVLLLIQLRRTLARVAKTREKCHAQLESAQVINRTRHSSNDKSLQNWDELKAQIQELERQYDMTQPLVNLVENMVKLGSLYRGHEKKTVAESTAKLMSYAGQEQIFMPSHNLVEFSNNVVESDRAYEAENFNRGMRNLYELNRGYHSESANLMSLHQDKDMLEWTLDSVRGKVINAGDNTLLIQKLRKQQLLLEKELTRVHNLLAHSTAKIEELTKENSNQEKEILLLKQKVQQALKNTSLDKMPLARANLESELRRVQSVVEELAQQRNEVANSIENMKSESQLGIRSPSLLGPPVRASPTGVSGSIPLPVRRKCQTTYMETDLDTFESRDLACIPSHIYFGQENDAPLYVNTVEIKEDKLGHESSVESPENDYLSQNILMSLDSSEADQMLDEFYSCQPKDINEADERMKRFYGILPREKPSEIKTVRIVKRESERRSRVRKKVSYDENHSLVWLVEEPDTLLTEDEEETDDGVFQEPYQGFQNRPTTLFFPSQAQSVIPSAREQLFGGQSTVCSPSSSSSEFRTPITPLLFLNKQQYPATTQNTTTTSTTSSLDYRAPFKKAKRRHYTISGSQPTLEQNWIKKVAASAGGIRSRDDMDMERCLRTVNTPDIVRSTIKKVEVFDDKLIERELSLPSKIVIPERYIEVEPPEELSASEKLRRKLKAETIRKMLSETTTYEDIADEKGPTETLRKKLDEEKKKRAHLLALNHAIAREVMEKSKMVAATHT